MLEKHEGKKMNSDITLNTKTQNSMKKKNKYRKMKCFYFSLCIR